jgi:urease accessory protein
VLHLRQLIPGDAGDPPAGVLTLPFDERRRSRRRVRLDDGREAALLLPRGTALVDGDRLRATDDAGGAFIVVVRAAGELLSVGRTGDPHRLTRAAYHLGNRHVPLQIGPDWLAWEHDHVLDDLARDQGLAVTTERRPFEPERGAHAPHAHPHEHAHGHGHVDVDVHAHVNEPVAVAVDDHDHDHDRGPSR